MMIIKINADMPRCNICNVDINDDMVEEHTRSKEHYSNLDTLKHIFDKKVYEDGSIGIEP